MLACVARGSDGKLDQLGAAPRTGSRAANLEHIDSELVVFSFPLPRPAARFRLSIAEREVAELVARGLTNREIAELRGTRVRTVANQVASLFRKLGVGSRVELASRI